MNALSIVSHEGLGPLDVTIQGPAGADIDFALSSGRTRHSVEVPAGLYAIIARRPNGEQLRRTVEIAGQDVVVTLADQIPPTPNEFMAAETNRGQIRATARAASRKGLPYGPLLTGAAARGLANTVSAALSGGNIGGRIAAAAQPALEIGFEAALAGSLDRLAARKRQRVLRLRLWRLDQGRWTPCRDMERPAANQSDAFLKVSLDVASGIHALGLIDGRGLGPVVMLPPFRRPVEVSFIAHGVLPRSLDRNAVPGGERTPVAMVHIEPPPAADMLAALASPRTPRAEDLWNQTAPALSGASPDEAIGMLLGKFQQPAEALLAAHFLVRFMPAELPLAWAENLNRALPEAVDGPVLAAWCWINNPPESASASTIRDAVHRHIGEGLKRPAVLFARTRALLLDALDLCGPDLAATGRALHLPFRRAGAAAGGLECFWGGGPASPGKPVRVREEDRLAEVTLDHGAFQGLTV